MDYTALALGNLILIVQETGCGLLRSKKRESMPAHYVELLFFTLTLWALRELGTAV